MGFPQKKLTKLEFLDLGNAKKQEKEFSKTLILGSNKIVNKQRRKLDSIHRIEYI